MDQQEAEDAKMVQDARIALLDYFGDHLRFWGTNALALAVALFAAMQAREFLSSKGIFVPVLTFLLLQGLFALCRAIYHGRMTRLVLEVQPAKNIAAPLIFRLHEAARKTATKGTGIVVAWSSSIVGWLIWSAISLFVGLLLNRWLGP